RRPSASVLGQGELAGLIAMAGKAHLRLLGELDETNANSLSAGFDPGFDFLRAGGKFLRGEGVLGNFGGEWRRSFERADAKVERAVGVGRSDDQLHVEG